MNKLELQMVDLLNQGFDSGNFFGVKAEFEAEGTRIDELLRLLDIARKTPSRFTVKIGGCEAIRDLLEAKQLGVDCIVAPMVESRYALSKYKGAIKKVYTDDDRSDMQFLFNLETQSTFVRLDEMMQELLDGTITGAVFGRSDFAGSRGLDSSAVDSQEITDAILVAADYCKNYNRMLVVGGGVSISSVANLRMISSITLNRFETRKIVFHSSALESKDLERDLLNAVKFELLWLKNKQDYYHALSMEDNKRFKVLNDRWGLV